MVGFSQQFHSTASKVYAFSGIALFLKVVPIETVSVAGATVKITEISVAIGAVATLSLYLILLLIVFTTRDNIRQNIEDRIGLSDVMSKPIPDDSDILSDSKTQSKYDRFIFISRIGVILESVFPVLFGIFVVALCLNDILKFLEHLADVVQLEFGAAPQPSVEGATQ